MSDNNAHEQTPLMEQTAIEVKFPGYKNQAGDKITVDKSYVVLFGSYYGTTIWIPREEMKHAMLVENKTHVGTNTASRLEIYIPTFTTKFELRFVDDKAMSEYREKLNEAIETL